MKKNILLVLGLTFSLALFSQSQLALEPVGRYIYQSSQKDFTGTDHLLNANPLSGGRMMAVSSSGLAIVDLSTMSVAGSTDYLVRSSRGVGGRDIAIYMDTFIYVNNHQSESKVATTGFGIAKITADGIVSVKSVTESNVFYEKLKIYGAYLYVAAHNNGIRIYDLIDPENPSLIGSLAEGFTDVFDMALSGDTLYVADGAAGLKLVDISDLNNMKIVASESITSAIGTAQDIEVRDGRVYVASGGAGLCVYDVSDIATRQVYPLTGCTEDVCWVGNYLAASTFGGVSVFEVGESTALTKVASENTSRYNQKAYIRTAFGVGAANDSTLMVSCWNSVDCYRLTPMAVSTQPDITCSTQRLRFPAAGGSETHYIVNQGGAPLVISKVTALTGDFSTTLVPQTVASGDTAYFDVNYTSGSETNGQTLYINSNDPDENPLPIQLHGNTSSLDPGEDVPDFTLSTFYTDPETGVPSDDSFTLSEQKGKVVWIQMFGTWCPACPSAEVDMQNSIVKEFADNPNVVTYVLNENQQERDPLNWVQTWTSHFYQRGPMLYDADGTVGGDILSHPNVGNMPFGRGFIIDQEGKVVRSFFGHQPQMVVATINDLVDNYDPSAIDVATSPAVRVFPNPVVDQLTVVLSKIYAKVDVVVFDATGKNVESASMENAHRVDLDFSALLSGVYVLRITTDDEVSYQSVLK